MTRTRAKQWLALSLSVLLIAACGGGDGDESSSNGDSGQASSDSDSGSDDGGGSTSDVPAIDPAVMPPAGEAHVEVDGKTFIFLQADVSERLFSCDITDAGVSINFQTDGHDLLIQGAGATPEELIVNITVSPEEGDLVYTSSNFESGGINAEAPYVVYVGEFDTRAKLDPTDTGTVGEGTISVTCP